MRPVRASAAATRLTSSAVTVTRVRDGSRTVEVDRAAPEEPLEIRLHGQPFAVIMRSPGRDRELAAGFLLSERVIANADDLGTIGHCTDPSATHHENIVDVTLVSSDGLDRVLAARRRVATTAACGMCGRLTIESLTCDAPPLAAGRTILASVVSSLPDRLRLSQVAFDETGGMHAAALFTASGECEVAAEDIGRHNAVDKVVGSMLLREALPLADRTLFVSGRTSFEIVQKALLAGIPLVASVSAPSSLAIELARDTGVTLVGFVRGTGFNIYAHPDRIA